MRVWALPARNNLRVVLPVVSVELCLALSPDTLSRIVRLF